jgi:hypothetical protein
MTARRPEGQRQSRAARNRAAQIARGLVSSDERASGGPFEDATHTSGPTSTPCTTTHLLREGTDADGDKDPACWICEGTIHSGTRGMRDREPLFHALPQSTRATNRFAPHHTTTAQCHRIACSMVAVVKFNCESAAASMKRDGSTRGSPAAVVMVLIRR